VDSLLAIKHGPAQLVAGGLTVRDYGPQETMLDGTCELPPVKRVQ
jgi:hypothetical protein